MYLIVFISSYVNELLKTSKPWRPGKPDGPVGPIGPIGPGSPWIPWIPLEPWSPFEPLLSGLKIIYLSGNFSSWLSLFTNLFRLFAHVAHEALKKEISYWFKKKRFRIEFSVEVSFYIYLAILDFQSFPFNIKFL